MKEWDKIKKYLLENDFKFVVSVKRCANQEFFIKENIENTNYGKLNTFTVIVEDIDYMHLLNTTNLNSVYFGKADLELLKQINKINKYF